MNYIVLDKHFTVEEGQLCFSGTYDECVKYKEKQTEVSKANSFMLEIHPDIE